MDTNYQVQWRPQTGGQYSVMLARSLRRLGQGAGLDSSYCSGARIGYRAAYLGVSILVTA